MAITQQPRWLCLCAASFSASIAVTTPTGHLSPSMSQYRDRAWATFPIQLYLKPSKRLKILKICSIYPLLQLITPCISNRWITLWMEIRVSWLMQYYHQSTTEVMISTWYSSTISNRRVLWEDPCPLGKVDSCLIISVSKEHAKSLSVPFWVFKVSSPELVYANDAQSIQASHNGVLLPLFPS